MRKINVLFIDYIRTEIGGGHFSLARLVNRFQKHSSLGVKPFVYLNNSKGFIDKFINNEVFVREYSVPKQALKINRKSSFLEIFFRSLLIIPFCFCFWLKLFSFCLKNQIDIMHTNSMISFLLSAVPAKLARVKLIFHLHDALLSSKEGGTIENASQKIILFLMKYFADAVIAVSDFVQETVLTKDRSIATKLYTLYNGVEIKLNSPLPPSEDKNDKIQLLSFGRLDETKGFHLGITVVSILKHQCGLKVEYLLLGEGSYKPALSSLSKKLRVEKEVQFLGFQDNVSSYIRQADIILVLSIWQEPFPLAIIESMANGKPVIATKTGGIPEIIEDGVNGLLVLPERAPEEVAEKVIYLINNPLVKQRIAENGLKRVQQNFNIEKLTNSLSQIYFSLLN